MTEQEAKTFAERLTRIWGAPSREPQWEPKNEFSDDEFFSFVASLKQEATLIYSGFGEDMRVSLELDSNYYELLYEEGNIFRCYTHPSDEIRYASSDELEQFANELEQFAEAWMPLFRRNCWLSGLPVEASAHEKMEWLRDFTQEEIDAWNLPF